MKRGIINNQKVKHPHMLILLASTEYQQEYYSTSELFFFLLHYSFLLQDNETTQKICTLKIIHFHVPQENGENGSRYLDPKYSRWISVDPALGEYVPAAGKSNETDKLPGMGGLFNTVNLSLYHYAGNNPVKYVDPDGRTDDYFTSTTYETYEIAIAGVQKYIKENDSGKELIVYNKVRNLG